VEQSADIETDTLPSGQPYARIGTGSRLVLSIPAPSFIEEATTPFAEAACAFLAA
jgi:hypothetical protein